MVVIVGFDFLWKLAAVWSVAMGLAVIGSAIFVIMR
jgi:hypothetical protein